MSERKRNIVLAVFLALLIVTLMSFSLTKARYSAEPEADGEYSGDLEYIVSNQIEINSVDEFFNAIENGYTNIQISDDVDNPLVISGGVSDVNSDLTIDLNGHELQRNNREPMLNVTAGVRLTIIDTKGGGGFYNPVGSVLRISGGTLTVAAGLFESGPRNNISLAKREATGSEATGTGEYAETQDSGASYTTAAGAELKESKKVTYYEKGEDGEYGTGSEKAMPVITPDVEDLGLDPETGAPRYHVNGNMYFEKASSATFGIAADTYLYYTLEGDNIENTKISTEGSADFYYEYYVTQGANGSVEYSGAEAGDLKVTVYGYKGVKASANPTEAGASDPNYAAIQMASGNIYVRGGSYTSYFGEANTYCVRATGGYMAASAGVGNFEAHGESECVSIAYNAPTEDEYLRVRGGHFYSEKGNTVSVTGGTMYVTGGDFHKDTTINGVLSEKDPAADEKDPAAGDNNAVIHIGGGKLFVGSADPEGGAASERIQFSLKGSYMYGIASTGEEGEVSVTDATFTFNGGKVQNNTATGETDNYGIYAQAGTVTAKGCVFLLPDKNSRGISAERGTLEVTGSGSASAKEGGLATSEYSYFYIDESVGGYGIYAAQNGDTSAQANENITITVDAQIFVGQAMTENGTAGYSKLNGAGIYMNAGTNSTITLGNTLVITAGNSVSGIYVAGGTIMQEADKKLVVVTGAKATGYTAGKKSFNDIGNYNKDTDLVTAGSVDVYKSEYTYGVYGGGGSVTLGNVYAAVYGAYAAGILTEKSGSNVIVNGALAMRVNGQSSATDPTDPTLSVSGISTESGNITLKKGADVNVAYGLGITARGGSVTFEGAGGTSEVNTVKITTGQGTAVYINNGTLNIGAEGNGNITAEIISTISGTSWATPPPDLQGGVTNQSGGVTNQSDGVYVQGGSLLSYGTFNVTHTGVANDDQYVVNKDNNTNNGSTLYQTFVTKSFAVRVEASSADTEVVIRKGTIESVVDGEGDSQTGGGGGLYVGSTGNTEVDIKVTLGRALGANESVPDLDIQSYGNDIIDTDISYKDNTNWEYRQSRTGGPAVEVNGGLLDIYYGNYSAKMGDGIRVKNGKVNIYDGTFIGADAYPPVAGGPIMAGAAASYGFKLYGGTVNIYDGTFGDPNAKGLAAGSGAFVMGTGAAENTKATANIYGGTFEVAGQAGFSVYQYVDVLFAEKGGENGAGSDIYAKGYEAGMAVEVSDVNDNNTTITVKSGTFEGKGSTTFSNGIWYGGTSSQLTIEGGEFIGNVTSGLYFNVAPGTGTNRSPSNVQLSGGKYKGVPQSDSYMWDEWNYHGAIGNPNSRRIGGLLGIEYEYNGLEIALESIIKSGYNIYNESGTAQLYSGSSSQSIRHNVSGQSVVVIKQ